MPTIRRRSLSFEPTPARRFPILPLTTYHAAAFKHDPLSKFKQRLLIAFLFIFTVIMLLLIHTVGATNRFRGFGQPLWTWSPWSFQFKQQPTAAAAVSASPDVEADSRIQPGDAPLKIDREADISRSFDDGPSLYGLYKQVSTTLSSILSAPTGQDLTKNDPPRDQVPWEPHAHIQGSSCHIAYHHAHCGAHRYGGHQCNVISGPWKPLDRPCPEPVAAIFSGLGPAAADLELDIEAGTPVAVDGLAENSGVEPVKLLDSRAIGSTSSAAAATASSSGLHARKVGLGDEEEGEDGESGRMPRESLLRWRTTDSLPSPTWLKPRTAGAARIAGTGAGGLGLLSGLVVVAAIMAVL